MAMFAQIDDDELVRTSELIALGEWVGQSPITQGGKTLPRDIGVIALAEVLKGPPATVALVAAPPTHGPRSSADIAYRRGDKGLWLLRRYPGGPIDLYAADHPLRFVAASAAARIAELRKRLGR